MLFCRPGLGRYWLWADRMIGSWALHANNPWMRIQRKFSHKNKSGPTTSSWARHRNDQYGYLLSRERLEISESFFSPMEFGRLQESLSIEMKRACHQIVGSPYIKSVRVLDNSRTAGDTSIETIFSLKCFFNFSNSKKWRSSFKKPLQKISC